MSTDCLINSLICFMVILGPVRSIRCDQGSNFMGAMKILSDKSLKQSLTAHQCDFVFNPPHASHMGGCWERHIRTIRNILNVMTKQHGGRLDTSSLRTLMYEVMAIINGRPLTVQNINDPSYPEPLTPNHLLTMKSEIILPPPGDFTNEDLYARKRWRQVQFLANEFWTRWQREYLLLLQERQKWHKPQRNFRTGDIVLLKDEDLVRGYWRMAKIQDTHTDKDDLVRRVTLVIGEPNLTETGKRTAKPTVLQRPVHKLTLLVESPT